MYLAQLLREEDEQKKKNSSSESLASRGQGKFAIKAMDKAVVRSREKV